MRRAVIIDVVRSPFGKGREGGLLASVHPADLYAQVLSELIHRTDVDPHLIEDVISGCVIQVGEQSGNIGRQAALAAGLPETTAAVTLDRKCGSAQQAMDFAAQGVIAGAYDAVIAGGVEMMSTVPMKANRMGKDNEGSMFHSRYPEGMIRQGISAELIAARWNLSREDLDKFSLRSHKRAASDVRRVNDMVTIDGPSRVDLKDESLRANTTIDKLASLAPAFIDELAYKRFPEISWSVTAGSSSPVSDGASAMLIMEEKLAVSLNLKPRAAISHFAVVGDDPIMMLTAVIPATQKLLKRAGLNLRDIDAYEVNEAFASVPLAWQKELDTDPEKLNVYGGAIALGHPVGASGGRLIANLLRVLEDSGGRYGLVTMCESGGMANATLIERLS
ncbi:MAG: thiolase family protein [Gammaproteobacteria bacterium]|jgi:acetyl-CoA acyltransferase|tara:strand:- start:1169 stop:2341 length:1173 start_codon:yes stop_codon:yes gene_type:complete